MTRCRIVRLGLLALTLGVAAHAADIDGANPEPVAPGASSGGGESPLPASAAAAQSEAKDPRPVVRLSVKNAFKPDDDIFPQIVEGRMISDLADMETFRMVGAGTDSDYLLVSTIRNLTLGSGASYGNRQDADSGSPTAHEMVTVSLDLDLALQDRQSKEVYTGKLSVMASRELEISMEHTSQLLTQELIDRAAQKLERLLRKKLPKSRS